MKFTRFVGLILLCLLIITFFPLSSFAFGSSSAGFRVYDGVAAGRVGLRFAPNEVLVRFKTGVADEAIESLKVGQRAEELAVSRFSGVRRWQVPVSKTVEEWVDFLNGHPLVEYAEPNYVVYSSMVPNDPLYGYQWHFDNPVYGGINLEEAWDITMGSTEIIIAVVDTGVAYENYPIPSHEANTVFSGVSNYQLAPDLAGTTFWVNEDEVPGNGLDDDLNGYVDDVNGYDFINDDVHPNDNNGHGTHVTGTVAQSTNNLIGVAGVAPNIVVMPVKVLDYTGYGLYSAIADGISYAADNGADIINLSLGGSSSSTTLENAVEDAYNKGVTIIAATGNDGAAIAQYPARYDDYVIAVGATRYDETLSYYSNYGPSLDAVAPGGDVTEDQNGDGYADGVLQQTFKPYYEEAPTPPFKEEKADPTDWAYYFFQGTSMATPHVVGVAALLLSINPSLTPQQIRNILESTAEDLGTAGRDNTYGWGLIDAQAACTYALNLPPLEQLAFDFGTSDSPIEDGYTQVTESTLYSGALSYGWTSTSGLVARDRGTPDDLLRDLIQSTTDHTFNVDLENGEYQITITIGDQSYPHDNIDVYAEDTQQADDLTSNVEEFQTVSFWITVMDGQLNIRLADDGGTDGNWVINALTIEAGSAPLSVYITPTSAIMMVGQSQVFTAIAFGGTQPYTYQWYLDGASVGGETLSTYTFTPGAADTYEIYVIVIDDNTDTAQSNTATATVSEAPLWAFDFGTSGSPVEDGYTQVTESTLYTGLLDYGWAATSGLTSRDRGVPNDLRRDLVQSTTDRTFNVDLANGDYMINVTIGDQSYMHDDIDVYAEDIQEINDLTAAAGTFQEVTLYTTVEDGQLNIRILDNGGTDGNWVINALTLKPGTEPPFEAAYDFGTPDSLVESEYTQVTHATLYSAGLGYGWTSTTGLSSRDRGTPDDLNRDLVQSMIDNTFNVDLPNGDYMINVTIGDQNYTHDNIDVLIEDVLTIDDLIVNTGSFEVISFWTTITDGQLNVEFHDRGGTDGNWVINALTVEEGSAPLSVITGFDSSNIGPYTIFEDEINFNIATEVLTTSEVYTYWTCFEVSSVLDKEVTFDVTNADKVPFLSTPSNEAQMVYSYDGDSWFRFSIHSYSNGVYRCSQEFTEDEVFVATFFPFSYSKMQDHTDAVSSSEWVDKSVLGSSEQDRDMVLLTITNPAIPIDDKNVIYIVARQHSAETSSSHMVKGLIDFLISGDSVAETLRNSFVWYIVPMVNPDGVYLGYSRGTADLRNANRDWLNDESQEISIIRSHIDSIDSLYGIDFFIDWHSQMNDDRWFNYVYSPLGNSFFSILSGWTDFDVQYASTSGSGSVTSCTARQYVSTNIIADPMFVFEPTPHLSTWTIENLEQEGENVAKAINDYF